MAMNGMSARLDPRHDGPLILTVNAGSSSIKFALFRPGTAPERLLRGKIERVGLPDAFLEVHGDRSLRHFRKTVTATDHVAAISVLMDWLEEKTGLAPLGAVGHRIVHGGPKYRGPVRISPELLRELRELSPFDPQHLPEEIKLAEALSLRLPGVAQVACFDTGFHRGMPPHARILPIPRRFAARGVERYGFHGLSYEFLMGELARAAGADSARGRIVLAHLGNGASMAAVCDGRPMDTSMALTPAAGLPMGTRTGDLDPGLVWYLVRTEGMSVLDFNHMINFQSGLLGISETSSDMRDLLELEGKDERAAEAVAVFCLQARKWIGAFAAELGGLDTLVFAGGIGENSPAVRGRVCSGLDFIGIELDDALNAANAAIISANTSRVCVRVIPTDEERVIAESVCRVLGLARQGGEP
jgi:acetate kinase